MNEVLREGLLIVGSYLAIVVIGFFLMNFLSAGFFTRFIKVRASRGKLVMVKVRGVTDHYYRSGSVTEKTLIYTARGQKEKKRIPLPDKNVFYRSMMATFIDVDEDKNTIIMPEDGKEVSSYDAEKYEQLIQRALYKPALMDKNEKIMLLMLGAVILGVIIVFFYVKGIDGQLFAMQEQLNTIKEVASKSVAVVN